MATYREYLWFKDDRFQQWWESGHVVVLIRGATVEQVLAVLGAFNRISVRGFEKLVDTVIEDYVSIALDSRAVEDSGAAVEPIGITSLAENWVLVMQGETDYFAVSDEVMQPVFKHHEVVGHYSNVEGMTDFFWWREGVLQVAFEPRYSGWKEEIFSRPFANMPGAATVAQLIPEVGGIPTDDDSAGPPFHHLEGAFALAEAITGVAITPDLLDSAEFTVALVPNKPPE